MINVKAYDQYAQNVRDGFIRDWDPRYTWNGTKPIIPPQRSEQD